MPGQSVEKARPGVRSAVFWFRGCARVACLRLPVARRVDWHMAWRRTGAWRHPRTLILLPFTYSMDSVSAFALLIGMFAVTSTSDTISSVMLGIPGTAASQATVLDGYPLAQQGQAARAFGAAFTVSAFGGVFGALVMAVSLPVILPIILALARPSCSCSVSSGFPWSGRFPADRSSRGWRSRFRSPARDGGICRDVASAALLVRHDLSAGRDTLDTGGAWAVCHPRTDGSGDT